MHAMVSSRSRKCLPADMLTEVLCRVPVESLVRCKSVCKSWHGIISSTYFVKTHLEYQKTSSNTNKYILHDQTDLYRLLTDCESVFYGTEHSKLYYTPESFVSDFTRGDWGIRIHGICDGMLCVSDRGYRIGDNIYLWNPICRKAKKLPKLLHISINEDNTKLPSGGVSFGCYDDDYKVIAISPVDHTYIVSIYSLSVNCWKIITNFYFEDKTVGFLALQPTQFVDGTSYMITNNRVLVCFNLEDDTIRQFKLPEELYSFEFNMEAYGKTVAVLGSGQLNSRYLYMWILRDKLSYRSPWEKKLVIELQEVGFTNGIGFLYDSQYLIRTMIFEGDSKLTKFFLCDLKSPKLTEFRCQDGYPDVGFIVSHCVESLLLLDENSLSPFVRAETGSTCSSTLFVLLTNKNEEIPNDLQPGKNVNLA